MSDDRRSSIVVIALLGNPFSPRYASAREAGVADALDHCAMNVSLHVPGMSRWALTERSGAAVARERDALQIGGSRIRRDGDAYVVDIDERCAPWASRVRGRVVLRPRLTTGLDVALGGTGEHTWRPHAPLARVEVDLDEPRVRFAGTGYLDENAGDSPLETAFREWSWSRVASADEVAIAYDVSLKGGGALSHGLHLDERGIRHLDGSRAVGLGSTRFALPRSARVERDARCEVLRTLEDGPFYARSVVATTLGGAPACGVHETLSLDRFSSRWVRFLLPFRMRVEAA